MIEDCCSTVYSSPCVYLRAQCYQARWPTSFNPSAPEAEAGGAEFDASQDYIETPPQNNETESHVNNQTYWPRHGIDFHSLS